MANTADGASVRADRQGGGDSSTPGRRAYRRTPSHTSGASLLRHLEIGEPRIFQRSGFRLAGHDDDRSIRLDLVARDFDACLARLPGDAGERRPARLALVPVVMENICLGGGLEPVRHPFPQYDI